MNWVRALTLSAWLFVLAAWPLVASGEQRVALVIGNSEYRHTTRLPNALNDARAMGELLRGLGFVVEEHIDLDARGTQAALQRFDRLLDAADVGLFFYAGHGLQVGGKNYLVPVDARLEREADLLFQAVEFDLVLRLLEQRPRISLVFLDACRDNPLARSLARSMGATRGIAVGRGLAPTTAGFGSTLIAYATQPNNVALDGPHRGNSPFTRALLEHLPTPGLEVGQVLRRVRRSVTEETRGSQVPWEESALTDDFYFVAPPDPPPPLTDVEVAFWETVRESGDPADLEAYLERFPQGMFAVLARNRLAALERVGADAPAEPQPSVAESPPSLPAAPIPATPEAEPEPPQPVASAPEAEPEPPQPVAAAPRAERELPAPAPGRAEVDVAIGIYPPADQERAPGTVFRDCEGCPELVVVPAGRFRIGSPADEAGRENTEGPMVEVTIERRFAIGRYEVTFAEWEACVAAGGCARRPDDGGFGRGRQPVINVDLAEVEAYLAWLSRRTGRTYRLPSEAEWEYAARAGSATRYSWGAEIGERQANCDGCLGREARHPRPVGSYGANPFGLFDMLGNVWEWTADCWNETYESARTTALARHDGNCQQRVVRGGSWASRPNALRSANRDPAFTSNRSPYRGFRVVRELTPPGAAG